MVNFPQQYFLFPERSGYPFFRLPVFSDIFDPEENGIRLLLIPSDAASVEEQGLLPDMGEFVAHCEILESRVVRDDVVEQPPQPGNIPWAVSQCVDQLPLGLLRRGLKECVKGR